MLKTLSWCVRRLWIKIFFFNLRKRWLDIHSRHILKKKWRGTQRGWLCKYDHGQSIHYCTCKVGSTSKYHELPDFILAWKLLIISYFICFIIWFLHKMLNIIIFYQCWKNDHLVFQSCFLIMQRVALLWGQNDKIFNMENAINLKKYVYIAYPFRDNT